MVVEKVDSRSRGEKPKAMENNGGRSLKVESWKNIERV